MILILKQAMQKGTKFHGIFVASVLLTFISGALAAPPPSTLGEANKLFEKQQWQAAERAYEVFARGASGKEKYEAQYKAAVCMESRKETWRAVSNFNQIIINAGALRDAPEIVAKAHGRLHAIYLPQKNSTPQRERVVAECARRLPNHEVREESGSNPKIRNMKNAPNNRKSTRKHENNLCKSLFLILGFDPKST